jgi:asparagine synthase (glutamine-hydrolysing)
MAKVEPGIQTFSIGFDVKAHSETAFARLVAKHIASTHAERIVGADAPSDLLSRVLACYDEPFSDGSALPTLRLSEFASRSVKVALSGDGGDEVFGGYGWYERWLKQQTLRRMVPDILRRHLSGLLTRNWPFQGRGERLRHFVSGMALGPVEQYGHEVELFSPLEKRAIMGPEWSEEFRGYDDYWHLRRYWRTDVPAITRLQYLDIKTYLPDDILTKVDRASMAFGLEVRPPLLDHRLIEAVFAVPARVRCPTGANKYMLRRMAQELVPAEVLWREKKGFSAPLTSWLAPQSTIRNGQGRYVRSYLSAAKLGLIERRAWGAKYWGVLVLDQWIEGMKVSAPHESSVAAAVK